MTDIISESDISKLKALDIRDVADRLGIEVSDRGNSHCFNTEAHANGDQHPSLSFYDGDTKFKCHGCGIGGDTIALVQKYEHIEDFPKACRRLAELMGMKLECSDGNRVSNSSAKEANFSYQPVQSEPLRIDDRYLYDGFKEGNALEAFYKTLGEPSNELKQWWTGRGLSLELLKKSGWKTFTMDAWEQAKELAGSVAMLEVFGGLLPAVSSGYDTVVPYFNGFLKSFYGPVSTTVPYVRVRNINKQDGAKYLSPKGLKTIIYGYDRLSDWLIEYINGRTRKPLYITESETDALAIRELALRAGDDAYAVALPGGRKNSNSLVVRELVKVLKKAGTDATIYIVTDRDETGEEFCSAVSGALYEAGFTEIYKWQEWDEDIKDIGEYLMRIARGEQRKPIKINERSE